MCGIVGLHLKDRPSNPGWARCSRPCWFALTTRALERRLDPETGARWVRVALSGRRPGAG